jgi:hypothetical protein
VIRSELLTSIVETTRDYRVGEIPSPTQSHVDRWIRQFSDDVQNSMLAELDHVLKQTYFSKAAVVEFLEGLIPSDKIAGADPEAFWRGATVLNIQQNGQSQDEILKLLDGALVSQLGLSLAECSGTAAVYVYVDDVLFSGNRIRTDLTDWIMNDAPEEADVYVVVIAGYKLGEYQAKASLLQAAEVAGKRLSFQFLATRWYESRLKYRYKADLLWPVELPDDSAVTDYVALDHKFPFEPRPAGGPLGLFTSEEARQLLERELLIAGARILEGYSHPSPSMRPLGFSPFGVGFGSLVVTYRNCPNNTPLALWWGLGEREEGGWYPLFPRKTYS